MSTAKLLTPVKLSVASLILLLLLAGLTGSFIFTIEENRSAQNQLAELFQNDPKVQREMTRTEAQMNSETFATDVLEMTKGLLLYPFYFLIAAVLLSFMGILTVKMNRFIPASLFSLAGVLSIFTILPPVLLFFASNRLFKTS
ncbi:MAG: DUF4064 domain-containing protein [Bacillota bacterium]